MKEISDSETSNFQLTHVDEKNTIFHIDGAHYIFHSPTLRIFKANELDVKLLECGNSCEGVESIPYPIDGYSMNRITEEYNRLKQQEIFSAMSRDKVRSIKNYDESTNDPIDMILLNVSHTCNLNCSYCFAQSGNYKGKSENPFMGKDVALKAIDHFLESSDKNGRGKVIDFFGGEPLLNFEIIHEIINYAMQKMKDWKTKADFGITTNGILLTEEIFNVFQQSGVRIMISIDGDADIHDTHRRTKNGQGSYRMIIDNITQFLSKRRDLFIARATVTAECLDLLRITNHLAKIGFDEHYFAINYCGCEVPPPKWSMELMEEYDRQYGYYTAGMLSGILAGRRVSSQIYEALRRLRTRELHVIPCQMSRGILVVTPSGDYYPCQRVTEVEDYRIGTVARGIDQKKRRELYPRLVLEKEGCRTCWARYLCGGGCPAASFTERGTDQYPDRWNCKAQSIAWKWIIWLYIQLKNAGYPLHRLEKAYWEPPMSKRRAM